MPAGITEPSSGVQSTVVKSAARVFEVLELFRRTRRHLSATEIGEALNYPKSSTNALLKSLVSLGYVVLNARTLRYFPSLSLTQLGDWIPSMVLGSGDAFDTLTEVHAATHETVTLSVQNDLSCRFLRVIPGTFPISLRLVEGFVAPLFSTAVGNAILSQLTDEEIESLVERANARSRKKSERIELAKVRRDVSEVRERGYAILYDTLYPDTGALAVALESEIPGFAMAIGVGGLRDRIRRNEISIYRAVRACLVRHHGRKSRSPSRGA